MHKTDTVHYTGKLSMIIPALQYFTAHNRGGTAIPIAGDSPGIPFPTANPEPASELSLYVCVRECVRNSFSSLLPP